MSKANNSQSGLTSSALGRISILFQNHPEINQVLIYGSRAVGTYLNGSDIDLTIKGDRLTISVLLAVENELDDLLLPYKFDVSLYTMITNNDLRNHIDEFGQIIYQKKATKQQP